MTSPHDFLILSVAFLAAGVITVPICKRIGLVSVLGYLIAGSILGPYGFGLVRNSRSLMNVAEIGVVMLLFLIGLELKPSRLWSLRKQVFGAGLLQVLITGVLLAAASLAMGLSLSCSLLVGFSLSLSSTAFSLQILTERKQLSTQFGRMTFSILLFQDLAAIPLLAIVPFIAGRGTQVLTLSSVKWWPMILLVAIVSALPFAMRWMLRWIALTRIRELFTAATLLLVLGLALLMANAGLSMALGSFLGGILLSDSEYRHQLEADIEPFKGLLLGLFFMAIGTDVNYRLLWKMPILILGLTAGYMLIKACVIYGISRWFGLSRYAAREAATVMPQGGEFAFAIFSVGLAHGLFSSEVADIFNMMISLSMAATPAAGLFKDGIAAKFGRRSEPIYDEIKNEKSLVIIAGFGRVGQVIGRVLRTLEIPFTALEQDPEQVEVLRRFGSTVYYGDASRQDLLEAAGARDAHHIIICIDDVDASLRAVDVVQANFPHLKIIVRARNRQHSYRLLDRGVQAQFRETLGSSLEMAQAVLVSLGYPLNRAQATLRKFRRHDEELLSKQHKFYMDEMRLIAASQEASQQLFDVMKADRESPSSSALL